MEAAAFFIVGPTAVGKSEIAAEVAAHCNGEIIGADAFQIYERMPILTARPSAVVLTKAQHHLLGAVAPDRRFDVAQYLYAARQCIAEISARGKLPIVSGGTGLYVRALTHGLSELPDADAAVRARLDAMSLDELQRQYRALDPEGAEQIDLKNKRRLIRAIEVSELTGAPFSSFRNEWKKPATSGRGVLLIRNREDLYARIDRRVEEMIRNGLLDEVRALGDIGATAAQAIGIPEARDCLAGNINVAECIERIQRATRRYAKRQLTWFRREELFEPLNLTALPKSESAIDSILQKILSTPN